MVVLFGQGIFLHQTSAFTALDMVHMILIIEKISNSFMAKQNNVLNLASFNLSPIAKAISIDRINNL